MRNEDVPMATMSEEEKAESMAEWGSWMDGLKEKGKLRGGLPFNPESAVILKDNGNTVSEGFYVGEDNLNVGGYIHIEASSLEEATELAQTCPALHGENSTIEIRELMEMTVPAK